MQIDLLDVFCGGPLGGNPLAVVRGGDDLSDAQMLALTRWLGFSETTFLLPPRDLAADYAVRIFSPGRELPFAGHPTLGSARAWLAAGGVPHTAGQIVQECGAGLIPVRVAGETLAFLAPPMRRNDPLSPEERAEAVRLAGVDAESVVAAAHADNGPNWVLLRLRSAADVLAARPVPEAPVGTDIGLVGPAAPGSGYDWEVRAFFADGQGRMREDPVTGSLNAGIALHLHGAGLAGHDGYVAAQGRQAGADGRVYVTFDDAGAWIGGATFVVAQGAGLAVPK